MQHHTPLFWRRFVDYTFTILQSPHKASFLEHLNSIDQHIQFTSEEADKDGSIPFLNVLIIPDEEGNLKTTVYRKPTHMDLYLQWDRNHQVSSKYSVIGSLQYRANTICSNKELLRSEEHHIEEALTRCKYPTWAINKAKMKTKTAANRNKNRNIFTNNNILRSHIVIPYYQGISESMKKACSEYAVQVYFKGGNTIKNLLMAPKDQDAIQKKVGSFIDTTVTGWSVMKNTLVSPLGPLVRGSKNISRHPPLFMNICRWIKEALYIRVNNPSLNKNIGKYHLPHI